MNDAHPATMIGRRLPTGCHHCGLSLNYCAAVRDMERRKCCELCQHPEP